MAITDKLSAIGNAIREKTGGTDLLSLDQMPAAILGIETGGEPEVDTRFKELIEATITDVADATIEDVRAYAFYGCDSLTNLSVPLAKSIGTYACRGCSNLSAINIVDAETINTYAFGETAIAEAILTACTDIGTSAFRDCANLETIDAPACTSIEAYAFQGCDSLEAINFPACKTISASAFYNCGNLGSVEFPAVTEITGSYAFYGCDNMIRADFGALTKIAVNTFNASGLTELIIRTPTVCTLSGTNALNGTPIKSGTGYIYVPDDLVDSYKAATNWATYAEQIKPISELEV